MGDLLLLGAGKIGALVSGLPANSGDYRAQFADMNCKTIRYSGHCEPMRLLMNGPRMDRDRDTLKRILEKSVPQTALDIMIIYAAVSRPASFATKIASTRGIRRSSPGTCGSAFRL